MIMAKGTTFTSNGGNTNGTITLNVNQLPSHSHGKGSLTVDKGGSHTHGVNDPGHTHNYMGSGYQKAPWSGYSSGEPNSLFKTTTKDTTGISITSSNSEHSHTISGSTSSTGSGTPINIMPPYEVAYCWKRTA